MSARFRTTASLAALLLFAFALRAFNLTGESLWRDEVDIIRFSLQPVQVLLTSFTQTGFNGPLYLLLMRAWLALAGVNDFALRYFSLLCGTVLIALVWALARRWAGRRAAWVAAWLLAVSPVHIWYAGEGKMYTLQPALLLLALYALARILSPHWQASFKTAGWWLVFVAATSCAFYVHVLSPIFLLVAAAVFICRWPVGQYHLKGAFIALVCLTVPYVPLLVWQLPTLMRGSDTGHLMRPLGIMAQILLADWSFGFGNNAPLFFMAQPGWVRWACMALFAGLAGLGFVRLLLRRPGTALGLLAWLTAPALLIYAVSTRAPLFEPRYVLWCTPALFILVGAGIAGERGKGEAGRVPNSSESSELFPLPPSPFPLLALGTLTLISLLGVAAQVARPIRPDMRAATQYVAAQVRATDVLVFQIPYGRYSFEYYLATQPNAPTPHILEAPYTNYGMGEAEVDLALRPFAAPNQNLWLIELEPSMWDARGMVRQWFDANASLISHQDFNGITVSLYRQSTS